MAYDSDFDDTSSDSHRYANPCPLDHSDSLPGDDVTDGALWAVKEGIADRERLCIYGASYGGYSSIMSAGKEPDLYKCAVGYVGVYDLELMYQQGDIQESLFGVEYLNRVLGDDQDDLRAQSPVSHASKIKADLFLVHGAKDVRVPIAHYNRLRSALDDAGKSYETLVKPNEAHGFYDVDNRVELYDRMLRFFDRNIGSKAN